MKTKSRIGLYHNKGNFRLFIGVNRWRTREHVPPVFQYFENMFGFIL